MRFPEVVKATPEVLAQQFELAGQSEKAIAYGAKPASATCAASR
ncbi:MAG: hypothetical protein WBQ55_15655 [Xanthobacteraceae bacterium]